MRMLGRVLAAGVLLIGGLEAGAAAGELPGPDTPPEGVVAAREAALVDQMKSAEHTPFEARVARLNPLLERVLGIERMARFLFGSQWRALDAAEQARFESAFLELSAATYAAEFADYSGERFEAVSVQQRNAGQAVVRRKLVTGKGREVPFDYMLMREDEDGGWRVVNIITDGVSDLAVKRNQYRRLLDDGGMDAVIAHIREATRNQRGA